MTTREEALVFFSSLRIESGSLSELYCGDFSHGSGLWLGMLLDENFSASSIDGVIGPFFIFSAKALKTK